MGDYWKDNNIKKPRQHIVCAANRQGRFIVLGARHFDKLMNDQIGRIPSYLIRSDKWEQGFIDQFGDFLTREEAMLIVVINGQPFNEKRNGCKSPLYSEGLY